MSSVKGSKAKDSAVPAGPKGFLGRHRVFFVIFAGIVLYQVFIVGGGQRWSVGEIPYSLLASDFSVGFIDKVLPGALFHLFFKETNETNMVIFSGVLLVLFWAALSFVLEEFYLSADRRDRGIYAALIFLSVTGSTTIAGYLLNLGWVESFWIFTVPLFFLCLRSARTVPLTLLFCVFALTAHSSAIVCYVPFFCILLLYRLTVEQDKTAKKIILATFAVCVVVSIGLFFYFQTIAPKHLAVTYEEYRATLEARGVTDFQYPDLYVFGKSENWGEYVTGDEPEAYWEAVKALASARENGSLIEVIRRQFIMIQTIQPVRIWGELAITAGVALPVTVSLFVFYIKGVADKSAQKLRRFVCLCVPALFALVLLVGGGLSFDKVKWFSHAYVIALASFMYMLYREKDAAAAYARGVISRIPAPLAAVYGVIYAGVVMPFFTLGAMK